MRSGFLLQWLILRHLVIPLFYAYVMGGSNEMVEYWLRSGMREAPEIVAAGIIKLSMIIDKNGT